MNTKKLLSTTALILTLAFSGMAYADHDWNGKGEHDGRPSFADVLPKDKAEQFHATMQQAHEKNLVLIDKMHQLREERRSILTAPKFDKEAFLAKSAELAKFRETLHDQIRTNMKEAFATAVSTLSQEERQALAASMEKAHHEHHHGMMLDGDKSSFHDGQKHHGYKHHGQEKHESGATPSDASDQ